MNDKNFGIMLAALTVLVLAVAIGFAVMVFKDNSAHFSGTGKPGGNATPVSLRIGK